MLLNPIDDFGIIDLVSNANIIANNFLLISLCCKNVARCFHLFFSSKRLLNWSTAFDFQMLICKCNLSKSWTLKDLTSCCRQVSNSYIN